MRVAILGGTGLIGAATAASLRRRGAVVTTMSRTAPAPAHAGERWAHADVTDRASLLEALRQAAPDAVVHLASYLQFACDANPAEAIRVNVDGTLNVLEACRATGVRRVVFGSSISVYGERHDLMREDDALPVDVSLYGLTKRMGESLGERYRVLFGLEFVALRYSGVFGPGQAHSSGMALVRQKIFECARGADVAIEGASGEERIHLTHVTDAAEATVRAIEHPRPAFAVYNVAGPEENYLSLRDLHGVVCRIAPGSGRALWSGRARSAGRVDTTRLRTDLGWRPTVAAEDGVRRDLRPQTNSVNWTNA